MFQLVAAAIAGAALCLPSVAGFTHRHRALAFHLPGRRRGDALALRTDASDGLAPWGNPPYLAVLTEPDACASLERVEETIRAIDRATKDGGVDLVVVRVADGPGGDTALHKWALLKNLTGLKRGRGFLLMVNDDVDIVLKALSQSIPVDGVHVKEHNAHLIPSIRSKLEHAARCAFDTESKEEVIIGTSCHSIESAISSYNLTPRGPDYLFVGTCYLTQSHPEKQSVDQLEGPSLPGTVKRKLQEMYRDYSTLSQPPVIFAIGGIDETNCHEPVELGADGVATIRTVMQSSDPGKEVRCMISAMQNTVDI